MQAQIRTATRQESGGFFRPRPTVCVFGDQVHYSFESWTSRITDVLKNFTVAPLKQERSLIYAFPEGLTLSVTDELSRWVFNGHPLKERWPTPQRRELVAGPYVIKVRPEDDALFFDVSDSRPAIDAALVAFYASLPTSD